MDRAELLNRIRSSRAALEAALARRTEAELLAPVLAGGWSAKDVLAHIGWWEQRVADVYVALSSGQAPPARVRSDDLDRVNKRVYTQYRDQSMEEVLRFEQVAYRRLLSIVESAPEDDLFNEQQFAFLEGMPFATMVVWNTYDHYDEHVAMLEGQAG